MIEVVGDFFSYADEQNIKVLVCTTNQVIKKDGRLVMGSGIAKAFKEKFQDLDLEWAEKTQFKKSGLIISWAHHPYALVGFPTKYHWRDPSDIRLIRKSLRELEKHVDYYGFTGILMTRPGCGNGGFRWSEIYKEMKHLDDRYVVISND